MVKIREGWGSRIGVILAVAGSAVGLGNFLRFPSQAAQNGGGAFMIPYFFALILIGIPLMWVEWTAGRYGGSFGHSSAPGIFHSLRSKNRAMKYIGVTGVLGPFAHARRPCALDEHGGDDADDGQQAQDDRRALDHVIRSAG